MGATGERLCTAGLVCYLCASAVTALQIEWRTPKTSLKPTPARSGHTAAADAEGNVFLFGGYAEYEDGSRSVVNDLWCFSNSKKEWVLVQAKSSDPAFPGQRLCSAAAIIGQEMLLFGGWDPEDAGTGGSILDDIWSFDLSSRKWSRLECKMPGGPTSRHVACTVNGQVVVHTFRCKSSVLRWDSSSRKLVEQPTYGPAPSSRGLHVGAACGSKLVIFGGADKSGAMCSDAFALDTSSWEWTALQPKGIGPSPRAGACAASIGETKMVVAYGAERSDAGGLDPRADVWTLDISSSPPEWLMVTAEGDAAARNAASLTTMSTAPAELLLHGGWKPFVKTYDDTHRMLLS
eukprot:6210481-Pleurochrysis_carterae.AAC.3